jgi:NAD(P)-dependent dehydrogenase (short-subunit alcohol dehydrogenase family)
MTTYSDRRRLEGRHVVVTGAAGGIGQVVCRRVHEEGAKVTGIDLRGDANEPLWQELEADFLTLDVSAPRPEIEAALEGLGPVHGLANVAGVDAIANFPDYDDDEFARVMHINARGPLHMVQALRSRMPAGASIVNTVTMDALIVLRTTANASVLYGATKAAMAQMTRELASQLGGAGIRVNGVAPGLTLTPVTAQMPDDRRQWIINRTAIGRIGRPEDIANAIAFLLSDASGFVTGQILPVDGGLAATLDAPKELRAAAEP